MAGIVSVETFSSGRLDKERERICVSMFLNVQVVVVSSRLVEERRYGLDTVHWSSLEPLSSLFTE